MKSRIAWLKGAGSRGLVEKPDPNGNRQQRRAWKKKTMKEKKA